MGTLTCIFRVGCVLLSVCATLRPIHLFNLDEDSLEIEFKDLHSNEGTPYPGIRVCFSRAILHQDEKHFRNTDGTKNQLKDALNPARLHIEDFIKNVDIVHTNQTRLQFTRSGMKILQLHRLIQRKGTFKHIMLRRFQSSDCLDIAIPFKKNKGIYSLSVGIKKGIFKKNAVPTRNEIMSGSSKLTVGMSHNGNSFRIPSQNLGESLFDNKPNRTCSGLVFNLKGLEVLRRRNKTSLPCIDYDSRGLFTLLNRSSKDLGCMPIGWEIPTTLPNCEENKINGKIEALLAALQYLEYNHETNPCRSIQDVQLEYNHDDLINACKNDDKTLQITAIYNKFLFKEIKMVRVYTVWNLISSVGVIFGVFYGVSFMQVPDMVKGFRKKVRRHISRKPSKRRKSKQLIHQSLDELKTERMEIDERLVKVEEEFPLTLDELKEELQNVKKDISVNASHRTQCIYRQEYETTLVALKNEGIDVYEKCGKAVEELQNVKKELSLIKNHLIQCSQKQDNETVV